MARTRTGVKITKRFLCHDKRDMNKAFRLHRLYKDGKLTERGLKTLKNLFHKRRHRYGDPIIGPMPKPIDLDLLKDAWSGVKEIMERNKAIRAKMGIDCIYQT